MRTFVLLVALAVLASCGSLPYPGPEPGPSPVPTCRDACENLARLGCPEGLDPDCEKACRRAIDDRITDLRPADLAAARTVEEARAVGTVTCEVLVQ